MSAAAARWAGLARQAGYIQDTTVEPRGSDPWATPNGKPCEPACPGATAASEQERDIVCTCGGAWWEPWHDTDLVLRFLDERAAR